MSHNNGMQAKLDAVVEEDIDITKHTRKLKDKVFASVFDIFDLDGNFNDTITYLEKERTDLMKKGFTDMYFEVDTWAEDKVARIYGSKPETDEDIRRRIVEVKRGNIRKEYAKKDKKNQELAQYRRLKKKFEGGK